VAGAGPGAALTLGSRSLHSALTLGPRALPSAKCSDDPNHGALTLALTLQVRQRVTHKKTLLALESSAAAAGVTKDCLSIEQVSRRMKTHDGPFLPLRALHCSCYSAHKIATRLIRLLLGSSDCYSAHPIATRLFRLPVGSSDGFLFGSCCTRASCGGSMSEPLVRAVGQSRRTEPSVRAFGQSPIIKQPFLPNLIARPTNSVFSTPPSVPAQGEGRS
jgi:hypothetical protein